MNDLETTTATTQQDPPVGYKRPPVATQFRPGQSGNPAGRPSAGASVREWVNAMQECTEVELREVARDVAASWNKRTAAERMLRTLERGDLADMEPVLSGAMTLTQLRASGVNTEIVKKAKTRTRTTDDGATEVEREVELFDRAGEDFDRICDRTDGKPKQSVEMSGVSPITSVTMHVIGPKRP